MKILTPDDMKTEALAKHDAFAAQFPDFDRLCVEQINRELWDRAPYGWCDLSLSIPKNALSEPLSRIPVEPLSPDVEDNEWSRRHRENEQARNHKEKLAKLMELGCQRFALMVQSFATLGFKVTVFRNPNTVFRVVWPTAMPNFSGLGLEALDCEHFAELAVTDD